MSLIEPTSNEMDRQPVAEQINAVSVSKCSEAGLISLSDL